MLLLSGIIDLINSAGLDDGTITELNDHRGKNKRSPAQDKGNDAKRLYRSGVQHFLMTGLRAFFGKNSVTRSSPPTA